MDTIQLNSVGVTIRATVKDPDGNAVDLTTLASAQLVFLAKSGARKTRAAAVDGAATLGAVRYVTQAGDLDEAGRWKVQAKLTFIDGSVLYTLPGKFKVKDNI
jgi:hypothetical protein